MSSVATLKFMKPRSFFRYHTKGVSNQVSSNSGHEIKSYSCSNSITKMVKSEKKKKNVWVTKLGNKGITHRGRFWGL